MRWIRYESCPRCRINRSTCWSAVQCATTVLRLTFTLSLAANSSTYSAQLFTMLPVSIFWPTPCTTNTRCEISLGLSSILASSQKPRCNLVPPENTHHRESFYHSFQPNSVTWSHLKYKQHRQLFIIFIYPTLLSWSRIICFRVYWCTVRLKWARS